MNIHRSGGKVGESVLSASGSLDGRIPAYVVKTGSDSSADKISAIGVSVTGPRR